MTASRNRNGPYSISGGANVRAAIHIYNGQCSYSPCHRQEESRNDVSLSLDTSDVDQDAMVKNRLAIERVVVVVVNGTERV